MNLKQKGWMVVYLLFALLVFISGSRQLFSNYYSHTSIKNDSISEARLAVLWQAENPHAYESLGRIFLRNGKLPEAAASLEDALSLRSADFRLWLLLGSARAQAGNLEAAKDAYLRAAELAPNYSEPELKLGSMYLRARQPEEAFRFLNRAAEKDPQLYPGVLELALSIFPERQEMIGKLIWPTSTDARKLAATYLIGKDVITDEAKAFILSPALSSIEKNDVVGALIENGRFSLARKVWLTARKPRGEDAAGPFYDGGFENTTNSDDTGFGWQFETDATGVAVSLDERRTHSGARSLKFTFDGNPDPGSVFLSQTMLVNPRTEYELVAFVRTEKLITAGPLHIAVYGGTNRETVAISDPVESTNGLWVPVRLNFNSRTFPIVQVRVERSGCNQDPCPIFGDLYLDDFSLKEVKVAGNRADGDLSSEK